jgi:hypothetical protein
VGAESQLATGIKQPRLMTRDETDTIRRRIMELCLRAYEPETRRGAVPPDIDRGALRVTTQTHGKREIWFVTCPTVWTRIDAVTLLHRLIGFEWRKKNVVLPLLPSSPELVLEALSNALGKKAGRQLLLDYGSALESGRYPEHRRFTRETLLSLAGAAAR